MVYNWNAIEKLERILLGIYTCRAESDHGVTSTSAELQLPPDVIAESIVEAVFETKQEEKVVENVVCFNFSPPITKIIFRKPRPTRLQCLLGST